MNLFPFFNKKKDIFSAEENALVVNAIREAEMRTSGEIRVFVESRCKYVDPMDRALEIFASLKMFETDARNAVLIYIALKDRQMAVYGDSGIHERVGNAYWQNIVKLVLSEFNHEHYAEGIAACVKQVGESLHEHFPYNKEDDKNELPDEIIFGK